MFSIILIDFSWLYNKYYYVAKIKEDDKNKVYEKATGMLEGFFYHLKKNYSSAKVLLVLDAPLSSTQNAALCPEYKQNRNKEEKKDVYKGFKDVVGNLSQRVPEGFTFVRAYGYEADQVIASIARKHNSIGQNVLIYSGDKDLLQLTYYNHVVISDKFNKGKFHIKTDAEIFAKFKNSQGDFTRISTNKRDILKYRVLKGDTSDNLKPVFPRIKDKEITSIIKSYWIDEEELTSQRIEDIIDNVRGDNTELADKLYEHKENWLRNYKLMNLYDLPEIEVKKVVKHG